MLYSARRSTTHGLGVFATAFLPRGTVWWRATLEDVISVSEHQYRLLTDSRCDDARTRLLADILHYAYYLEEIDRLLYICDDARYLNHSFEPNSEGMPCYRDEHGTLVLYSMTLRDVEEGEELFEDYTNYDHCTWAPLYGDFGRMIGA
jgi:SET domain-containing protein